MKILIAGASGLIGSALKLEASKVGHEVASLSRSSNLNKNSFLWNPDEGKIDLRSLEGTDVIINLSGENIAKGRWSDKRKKEVIESRVKSTSLLVESLSKHPHQVKTLINASAIGYYGSSKDILTEDSPPGTSFLSEVCTRWEKEAIKAQHLGLRVVTIRLGIVLSPQGGALKNMLPIFKLGLGGVLGDGKQYWSWISLEDSIRAILHILNNENLSGPVNLTSGQPTTNAEFSEALAKSLGKKLFFPVPKLILTFALGEMAEELLLADQKVVPNKLANSDFQFQDTSLEEFFNKKKLLGEF